MYRYKYVPLEVGGCLWFDNRERRHRTVIDEGAAKGWRYVGCVPTRFTGHGGVAQVDLIFEKECGEDGVGEQE